MFDRLSVWWIYGAGFLTSTINIAFQSAEFAAIPSLVNQADAKVGYLYSVGSLGIVLLALAAEPLRKHWSFSTVALGALMVSGVLQMAFALTTW